MIPLDFELHTPRLTLRRLTTADEARVCEIQSNWNVARMLRMAAFPPSLPDIREWLSLHEAEWEAGSAYRFAVVLDGQVTGCVDIDEIASGAGELGYWLDEAYWGRGMASEAAAALVKFAFETVGLQRLLSGHAADNPASGRVLSKLGFEVAGDVVLWSRSRRQEIQQRQYALSRRRSHDRPIHRESNDGQPGEGST